MDIGYRKQRRQAEQSRLAHQAARRYPLAYHSYFSGFKKGAILKTFKRSIRFICSKCGNGQLARMFTRCADTRNCSRCLSGE